MRTKTFWRSHKVTRSWPWLHMVKAIGSWSSDLYFYQHFFIYNTYVRSRFEALSKWT